MQRILAVVLAGRTVVTIQNHILVSGLSVPEQPRELLFPDAMSYFNEDTNCICSEDFVVTKTKTLLTDAVRFHFYEPALPVPDDQVTDLVEHLTYQGYRRHRE